MNSIKTINVGHRQLKFGFDQSEAQDLRTILAHIDARIANNDYVTLEEVVLHFAGPPERWTKNRIIVFMVDLFMDETIQFLIEGEKILPQYARQHLSEPSQWAHIEIVKPEVVEKADLAKAQQLGATLFGIADGQGQNSLCRFLRKHLRSWEMNLETFCQFANTDKYPGKDEIDNILLLLEKLLPSHDPAEFIKIFINKKDALIDASVQFARLSDFYKNHFNIWKTMIEAVEAFKPDKEALKKDPEVKNALQRLSEIMAYPIPYSMIWEISGLVSSVKTVHDAIVEKKKASVRSAAIEEVEKKIEQITVVLDRINASRDLRNRALFLLQALKRNINNASSIFFINQYSEEATIEFDRALDLLDEGIKRRGISPFS